MRLPHTRISYYFVCFIYLSFLINLSCNKDQDLFVEKVLNSGEVPISELDSTATDEGGDDEMGLSDLEEEIVEFESRETAFPSIHDAYIQSGKGYNLPIVRLEENRRASYLMFDLSQIDSIGASITSVNLEFFVNQDDGSGEIQVFKGSSNEWAEDTLSEKSAPEKDTLLGSIEQDYKMNTKISIDLQTSEVNPGILSLVLNHSNGDDLAFASKENSEKMGGRLIVTYDAPVTSEAIVFQESQNIEEEVTEEETTGEGGTEEETTEEETTGEEGTEEETTEEETNEEEETTEGETNEEEETEEEETEEEEEETEEGETETEEEETENNPPSPSNAPPTAVAKASPSSGEVPLEVTFTGSDSSDDNTITEYAWNYKDGSSSSTSNPTHTFTEAGTYNVDLTVADAEGLNSKATIKITVIAQNNEAPVSKASASITSGTAPLEVNFTGSNSTDDDSVTGYSWDFKDGASSTQANPTHTFNDSGTYEVELTVNDGDGLSDKDTVIITVDVAQNEPPNAVATASSLSGTAPLQVDFTGSSSSDDNGIASYNWNLPGNSSSNPNTTYTFNDPGTYDVALTVTDDEGLEDTVTLTISISQESIGQIPCSVGGGKAGDTGSKIWCWENIDIPTYSGSKGVSFSNRELTIDSECNEQQITKVGNRLKFRVNPTTPNAGSWCSNNFNMRAEVRTSPWQVNHPRGTEEWFGWSYTLGNDYIIDKHNQWLFWQVHHGVVGDSPHTELMVIKDGQFSGHSAGEIYVANGADSPHYIPTGITPRAGDKLDIVVHAVWDTGSNGLLQIWINGQNVYDGQVSTVYSSSPWGGNAKWGIYKWPWREESGVQQSLQQGITHLETYMGTLRQITRRPGDPDYRKDSYSAVAPN